MQSVLATRLFPPLSRCRVHSSQQLPHDPRMLDVPDSLKVVNVQI